MVVLFVILVYGSVCGVCWFDYHCFVLVSLLLWFEVRCVDVVWMLMVVGLYWLY